MKNAESILAAYGAECARAGDAMMVVSDHRPVLERLRAAFLAESGARMRDGSWHEVRTSVDRVEALLIEASVREDAMVEAMERQKVRSAHLRQQLCEQHKIVSGLRTVAGGKVLGWLGAQWDSTTRRFEFESYGSTSIEAIDAVLDAIGAPYE